MRSKRRPHQRDRQQRGQRRRRRRSQQRSRRRQMLPRPQPQLRQHRAQFGRWPARQHVRGLRAVALHQVGRQIALPARRMDRQRPQQPGDRIGHAGMARERADAGIAAVHQDARRKLDQRRRGPRRVAFEIGQRRHRIVVEIERPRIDQVGQHLRRQAVAHHHVAQRRRDRMRSRPARSAHRATIAGAFRRASARARARVCAPLRD